MVHDALRAIEEKGTVPDKSWIEVLKEAAATAFLGMHFIFRSISTHTLCFRTLSVRDSAWTRYSYGDCTLTMLCWKNSLTRP